jgi:hypothetical protein
MIIKQIPKAILAKLIFSSPITYQEKKYLHNLNLCNTH